MVALEQQRKKDIWRERKNSRRGQEDFQINLWGCVMNKVSPMSDEFYDWLDQCPVTHCPVIAQGHLDKNYVYYCFETPKEEACDE